MENLLKKTREYSVLLIDDEIEIREGMSKILERFFKRVDTAQDGQEGFAKYLKNEYEVVITDLTMPKMNGIELLNKIKELNPNQKVIVLTAHQDKGDILEAISAQADGYIIKPFNIDIFKNLLSKISYQIELEKTNENYKSSLEKLLLKKTEELRKAFFFDKITKLYNFNKLKEDLKELKNDIYFIGIDVSNFRKINSIFGIEIGNRILEKIGLFLNNLFSDVKLYRLQDSSFGYVFPKDKSSIKDILDILNKELSNFKVELNSIEIKLTFKVIAVSGKDDILSKYSLISSYIKDKGIKQIYKYFDSEIEEIEKNQKNRLFWINKSIEAVNTSNIIPFFQPIVDNYSQNIIKYEVLARLKNGDEYVSPYFFIEPAKEAGILVYITKMIIEKSFEKIANTDLSISINITTHDLEENYLIDFLDNNLKKNNLKESQITIEILEGIESQESEKHLNQLLELKSKGYEIAIDDFGTGYSNFERVYQINPDFIKIDGIYIKNITTNLNSLNITKSIINFAKTINAKTIAEFVSSEEIYKKVKELGVDYSQGYYFSEPTLNIKQNV